MSKPTGKGRWLVTGWPGMGSVAVTAAVYLMSKLRMHEVGEFEGRDLFELEHAEVRGGLVRAEQLPRSRLFMCDGSTIGREIVVFTGEAQPVTGKSALCERLLDMAQDLGVNRVVSFAAAASELEPSARSRVFGVATDNEGLSRLRKHEIPLMADGRISGLNGVLLAAAAEKGIPGIGLLGEVPVFAPSLPYPAAAAAVLRSFAALADFELDLSDLEEYGKQMQEQLAEAYQKIREALERTRAQMEPPPPPNAPKPEAERPGGLDEQQTQRVEAMFADAKKDREKAFALKQELDKLGAFRAYEDRFLELFKKRRGKEG